MLLKKTFRWRSLFFSFDVFFFFYLHKHKKKNCVIMVCSNQRPQSSRRCSNSQSLQSLTPVLNLISVESIMPLCSPPLTPLHCSCWPNLASQLSAFTPPHCQSLCQPISLLYPVNCLSFAAQRVITTPLWQCSTTETRYSVRRM